MSVRRATNRLINAATAIASTGTVTKDMDLRTVSNLLSIILKMTSATGTPSVKLEYMLGRRNASGVLEYEAATAHTDLIADHTSEVLTTLDISTLYDGAEQIRFLFTGSGTNPADTVIDIFEVVFEEDAAFAHG